MEDLNRMFAQAGLRFDPEFLNRVFFNADNVVFRVYYSGPNQRVYTNSNRSQPQSQSNQIDSDQTQVTPRAYKPNFIERWSDAYDGLFPEKRTGP